LKRKQMHIIKFKFEQAGLAPIELRKTEPGYSLLVIAVMNNISLLHNCGGICACSTCHIYLEKGKEFVHEVSDREKDFIERAINARPVSRLACQCLLRDGRGEIEVTIPDQRRLPGG
jgi:ferredoxin, 2Fe-2S